MPADENREQQSGRENQRTHAGPVYGVDKTARAVSSGSRRNKGKGATETAPTEWAIRLVVSDPKPR